MADDVTVTCEEAETLIARALENAGGNGPAARSTAIALTAAEAEGQVGHGFSRVADYAAQLRSGKLNGQAAPTIVQQGAAAIRVDAQCGLAYPALDAAISAGVPLAQEAGCAVMAVGNSHHCGALSVQVDRVARAGLIAIMVANTPKAMAPWGGATPVFGTNPIAFATPRATTHASTHATGAPLVIDLSLSVVARGKVMNAARAGQPIPEGWALDAQGHPTTDAQAALRGTMVPIGGAKGTALALMVELLAAAFTGSAFSSQATSFFEAEGAPPRVGQTLIALKPGDDYAARAEELLTSIAAMPGVRLPGARRHNALERARRQGLTVAPDLLATVTALAGR